MENGNELVQALRKLAFARFKELDARQDKALADLIAVSQEARSTHEQLGTILKDDASMMRLFQMLDGGIARENDWKKIRDRDDQIESLFKDLETELG